MSEPKLPPLFLERLTIKQLDTSSSNANEILALDLAFPLFRQLDAELLFQSGWTSVSIGMGSKSVFVGRGRERRYAGDKTLERGRYWSVCVNGEGFDHSTLLNEIRAYHSYTSRSEVHVYDTTCDFEKLGDLHEQNVLDLGIVLRIAQQQFGRVDAPFLLLMITAMDPAKAEQAQLAPGRPHVFLYGLRIVEVELERVFDLRLHACREWLLREFLPFEIEQGKKRRAENNVHLFGNEPPSTIEELFPILLSAEIGGANPFIQAIGSRLRCCGCSGIVFPSARSDSWSDERNGIVEGFGGWNFVDFRGTGPGQWRDHIGHIMSFNIYLGKQFSIKSEKDGDFAHVEIHGLLRQNIGRFNTMAHHAQHGTDPSLLDLAEGFISVLDISHETLTKSQRELS